MPTLTIVQLAPLFGPLRKGAAYGSIERLAMLLDDGLTSRGHRSVMVALEGSQVTGQLLAVRRSHDYSKQAQLAIEFALDENADVIQTHRREFLELGAAKRLRELRPEVKIVSTLHGSSAKVRGYYSPHASDSHFIFVSRAQANELPGLPGSVIHNAVDVNAISFGGTPDKPGYLIFLGRVCAEKGIMGAIELAQYVGLPLRIAGIVLPGDQPFFDSSVAPRLRPGHVEYLGPVDDVAKIELLRRGTALVLLPEYEDPCPLTVIEALAAGAPVLALARGGLTELVEDGVTGLIAENLVGLCGKLGGLMMLDRRQCRLSAVRKFDYQRMVGDYLAVYLGIRKPSSARDR